MKSYKLLMELRKAQETNHKAAATGYFDHKYRVKPPKTAAHLEALIEELIGRSGGMVSIISSAGRQLYKQEQVKDVLGRTRTLTDHRYIPSTTKKGTPDLLGVSPKGKALSIEVKFSKSDRLRPEQIEYKNKWEAAGGVFIIARTLDDIIEIL